MSDKTDVDIHLRARAEGVRQGAQEARDTIRDLKEEVVRRGAEMAGVSTDLAVSVARVGAAFLTVGAAAYGTWKAYSDGKAEIREMNLAIAKTGEYSGQSAASLRALAGEMAATSTLTVGEAKSIETALAASGQIGAAAFRQVSLLAGDFARVMGTDVAKVAPELVKLFDDPAKGAAELNRTMHFLSAAELDHIEHLQRMGEVTQAQAELAGKLKDRLGEIAPQLGTLERGWDALKGAASRAWDAMLGIGREATVKQKLDAVLAQINDAENSPTLRGMVPGLMQKAMRLQDQMDAEAQKKFDANQSAEQNRRDQQARSLANRLSRSARSAEIDDEIRLLEKSTIAANVKTEAIAKLREEQAKLFAAKPVAKTPLARMLEKGQKNQLDDYYETGGEETMRLVAEKRELASAREAMLRDAEQQKASARITHDLTADYRKTTETRQRAAEAEQLTESQRRLASALDTVDNKARAAREALDLKFPERERESKSYRDAVATIDAEQKSAAASAREWAADQERLNSSWEVGAVRGLRAYGDEAANVANQVASSFRRGAQMAEDALANFVVKGKLDIRSLAEFAAVELARQNIVRPLISAGSSWLQGLFSFGGLSTDGFGSDAGLAAAASIGGFASGGDHAGGWRIVGERGPELEATGPSRIFTADQTRDILAGAGGGAHNIRVEVVNPPGRAAEVASATPRIDIDGTVLRIVMREMEPGGRIARQQERQYGLNAAAGVVR